MDIGVYIGNGGLNTLNVSDSMIDQLAALAQAESHFRSEAIKFGIRHRMRSGKTLLNHTQFLGYTKGPDGVLQMKRGRFSNFFIEKRSRFTLYLLE